MLTSKKASIISLLYLKISSRGKNILIAILLVFTLKTSVKYAEYAISIIEEIPPIYSWTGGNITELSIIIPFESYNYNNPHVVLEIKVFPDGSVTDAKVIESSGSYELDEYAIDHAVNKYENKFRKTSQNAIVVHEIDIDISKFDHTIWEIRATDEEGISSPVIHDVIPKEAKEILCRKDMKLKTGFRYQILMKNLEGEYLTKEFEIKEQQEK